MHPTTGVSIPWHRPANTFGSRVPRVYRQWFIGSGVAGLLYTSFAWIVLLAGTGKSRFELALQLPLRGWIRLLEWIHCPDAVAIVIGVFPPITGLIFGLLALGACWAWRALGLRWDRAKFVLIGGAAFECALLAYGCATARLNQPGPHGSLALPGRGDPLLALALSVLFVCGICLVALSPAWEGGGRGRDTLTSGSGA